MRTALITGGSRGIGEGMVRLFASRGYRVMFSYHQAADQAAHLQAETGAIPFQADLRLPQGNSALAREALRQLCHVDALIVNAGTAWSGLLTDMPLKDWDSLMSLHLTSPFLLLKDLLPVMRSRGEGSVVFISSMWGRQGAACEAAYSAAKAGQIALVQALAREEGSCGIRVNALCPGVIDTDMLHTYTLPERETLKESTPLGRLGLPQDVAQAAFFLCSPEASFITGQALNVDGGFITT